MTTTKAAGVRPAPARTADSVLTNATRSGGDSRFYTMGHVGTPRTECSTFVSTRTTTHKEKRNDYLVLFHETLPCRSERLRNQVLPAKTVHWMAIDLNLDKGQLIDALGLPRSTISRKIKTNKPLNPDEMERVNGMQRLVGQVQAMVAAGGAEDDFDAAKWFGEWIEQPLPALDGERPAKYLGDSAGRELVSRILSMIQAGAFA